MSLNALPDWSAQGREFASRCLLIASVLIPGGFIMGGIHIYDGDPGLGVMLVPVGTRVHYDAGGNILGSGSSIVGFKPINLSVHRTQPSSSPGRPCDQLHSTIMVQATDSIWDCAFETSLPGNRPHVLHVISQLTFRPT